jgi:hypothetical protein
MEINVREYRRGNPKWTIQRNWQQRVHTTNKTDRHDIIEILLKVALNTINKLS